MGKLLGFCVRKSNRCNKSRLYVVSFSNNDRNLSKIFSKKRVNNNYLTSYLIYGRIYY